MEQLSIKGSKYFELVDGVEDFIELVDKHMGSEARDYLVHILDPYEEEIKDLYAQIEDLKGAVSELTEELNDINDAYQVEEDEN